eukprot:gene2028-2211_t
MGWFTVPVLLFSLVASSHGVHGFLPALPAAGSKKPIIPSPRTSQQLVAMVGLNANDNTSSGLNNLSSPSTQSLDMDERVEDEYSTGWKRNRQLLIQIANVAFPAFCVCIVEPALSIVDMFFVSKYSLGEVSTQALAALSVNGAIFNLIAAVTSPLCTGTTAVVSKALGREDHPKDSLEKILIHGIVLALLGGSLWTVILHTCKGITLSQVFGLDVFMQSLAGSYLSIRALALPFTLLTYVIIGFSLAVQDGKTPLRSIIISTIVNVLGDWLLVGRMKLGLAGAAWATTISTICAALGTTLTLFYKHRQLSPQHQPSAFDSKYEQPFPKTKSIKNKMLSIIHFIQWERLREFFSTSLLLLAGALANTVTYSSGARISAVTMTSSQSVVHIAAHQIVMQLWWFVSFFSSSLSLAAQSLLPAHVQNNQQSSIARRMTKLMLNLALIVATVCTAIMAGLLYFPSVFTNDLAVQGKVQMVRWQAISSMFIICVTTALDGIFIGWDRVWQYIGASVLSSSAAWAYFLLIALPNKLGVKGAWNGIVVFSSTRLMFYLLAFWLNKPKKKTQQIA